MKVAFVLAVLGLALVPAGQSAPASTVACRPLPRELQGAYYRSDDGNWKLTLTAECTYGATENGRDEGGGTYTLSSDGAIVLSNDHGCRDPGMQDLPTTYDYSYDHGALMLAPEGGVAADLCVNPKGEGRAQELAGHGGWIKIVAGRLTLSITGVKKGSYAASGAIEDRGSFTRARSRLTRGIRHATLWFTGPKGTFSVKERVSKGRVTWRITAGTGAYRDVEGGGSGSAHGAHQTLRAFVSN
jgi:hypothetical protein